MATAAPLVAASPGRGRMLNSRTGISYRPTTPSMLRRHFVSTSTRCVLLAKPSARYSSMSQQGSFDDEFRSSRSIALGLHKRYRGVLNAGLEDNLKEFIHAGVTAYALGCTEEGLRKELLNAISQAEAEECLSKSQSLLLKSAITREEAEECILWVAIVFTTIMSCPPPTVVRWSTSPAVSPETLLEWRGFCGIISNAYYNRGMAWLPVKTLQMEQLAVLGRAEEAALVADRMRLSFTTLELISPQWPKN